MSKKANPKAIGGFVIGAVILAVTAVVVFGSERWFEERRRFVLFFEGSVSGLAVGSPVLFRGVNVGTVAQVTAVYQSETTRIKIPVLVDIPEDRVIVEGENLGVEEGIRRLIDRGMRASLVTKSLVTGQQIIEMDMRPGTEIQLFETALPYPQIPTVPSQMDQITRALSEDAPRLLETATETLEDVQAILTEKNRRHLANILQNSDEFMTKLNQNEAKIDLLMDEATQAATEVGAAADQLRRVGEEIERDPSRFLFGKPGEKELR